MDRGAGVGYTTAVPSGSRQRGSLHQANVSAQEALPPAGARLSPPHVHKGRRQTGPEPPSQGAPPPDSVAGFEGKCSGVSGSAGSQTSRPRSGASACTPGERWSLLQYLARLTRAASAWRSAAMSKARWTGTARGAGSGRSRELGFWALIRRYRDWEYESYSQSL